MKLGIVLPQHDSGREQLLGAARLAETVGLDSVWAYDTLRPKAGFTELLECWTTLSAAAAVTERITLGPLVLRVTLRNVGLVGHMARGLHSLAPGRVIMGLGTGDTTTKDEQIDFGFGWLSFSERLAVLEEQIDILRRTVPGVPIWIGGEGEKILSQLPLADGWSYWGPAPDLAAVTERADKAAGAKKVEVCWGWRTVDEAGLIELNELGVDHAVMAVPSRGYAQKIEWLASMRSVLKEPG